MASRWWRTGGANRRSSPTTVSWWLLVLFIYSWVFSFQQMRVRCQQTNYTLRVPIDVDTLYGESRGRTMSQTHFDIVERFRWDQKGEREREKESCVKKRSLCRGALPGADWTTTATGIRCWPVSKLRGPALRKRLLPVYMRWAAKRGDFGTRTLVFISNRYNVESCWKFFFFLTENVCRELLWLFIHCGDSPKTRDFENPPADIKHAPCCLQRGNELGSLHFRVATQ